MKLFMISSAMAREAWSNALNAQLFKSKVGFYFLSKIRWIFSLGFSETALADSYKLLQIDLIVTVEVLKIGGL